MYMHTHTHTNTNTNTYIKYNIQMFIAFLGIIVSNFRWILG